jgi:hypothetical protein
MPAWAHWNLKHNDFETKPKTVSLNIPVKYTVITTFHDAGYKHYASRMIDSFLQTWPKQVLFKVYAENCNVLQRADNLEVLDLEATCSDLVKFKDRWRHVPKANGDISQLPNLAHRKDSHKSFKWDAVRFAHKVYAVFHAVKHATTPWVIWMDADMICHSPIPFEFLDQMCPDNIDLAYLGRQGKFSECGLYAIQVGTKGAVRFVKEFQRMYNDAENGIFTLGEWHDSYVFDDVKRRIEGIRLLNWASNLGDLRASSKNSIGEGHPLINSAWGAYLDHLKGDRKDYGHSLLKDIKVSRPEAYWQGIR